ncbi:hypothetical protein [Georgenia wangjunii]|uniref:hypothetical protein n=1 Tax=Georgenia wangjunii TaxID=3117730 RepID=UPI002F265636
MEILLVTVLIYVVALLVVGYVLYRAVRAGVRDGILGADQYRKQAARDTARMSTDAAPHPGTLDS